MSELMTMKRIEFPTKARVAERRSSFGVFAGNGSREDCI